MEDKDGWKFGALAAEEWMNSKEFYGNGESSLYTFKDKDPISFFPATGENSMY